MAACPCGCTVNVKPGRVYAQVGCYWRAAGAEARQLRARRAIGARTHWSMDAAHRVSASRQRQRTLDALLTLAVEGGQVRHALQLAYRAGYQSGANRKRRQELKNGEAA